MKRILTGLVLMAAGLALAQRAESWTEANVGDERSLSFRRLADGGVSVQGCASVVNDAGVPLPYGSCSRHFEPASGAQRTRVVDCAQLAKQLVVRDFRLGDAGL